MARRAIRGGAIGWREARVGALILVALALLAYGIFRIGEIFDVFADRYELVTLFPNAAGLTEGSPVTLAGQRVGQVKRIDFIPMEQKRGGNHVALTLAVAEEVQEQIREDSQARLRTQGLLGDRFVDVAPGTPAARVLQPGDTLPSVPPPELEDVLATAAEVLADAQRVMRGLSDITGRLQRGEGTLGRLITEDDLYLRLAASAGQLETVLQEINRMDGALGRLIRDPTLYAQLGSAIARVDSVGGLILRGEGTLSRLLRTDSLYQDLVATVGRADSTLLGLSGFLRGATAPDGSLGRFLTDPALYDELLRAVLDLQRLINDIRTNPRRYRPEVNVDVF
jgi:phospholipid/cholesterol/gamma-HCH transport system substrate-binding protein